MLFAKVTYSFFNQEETDPDAGFSKDESLFSCLRIIALLMINYH